MSFDAIKSFIGLHDPAALAARTEALVEEEKQLSADLKILESDLDGYDTAGYEHFRDNVLPKELDAIAHKLAQMDESPDARDSRIELRGRYKQVKDQMTRYSVLSSRRSALMDALRTNLKSQAETQEEIRRDQERRAV